MLTLLLSLLQAGLLLRAAALQSVGDGCSCTSGTFPVPINISLPVDPTQPLNSSSTVTRQLDTTFDIFGLLCAPANAPAPDRVQLLLHGMTYSSSYWTFPNNGFQNYSYVAHSCAAGLTSFAYDQPASGQSTRPENASDVQLPTLSAVASAVAGMLKDGTVGAIFGGVGANPKVIAIGHSLGSVTYNYAAILQGSGLPIDALILTGEEHDNDLADIGASLPFVSAAQADPARWGTLDPDYVTTSNISSRSLFYPPSNDSFSTEVLAVDELTKDVGSIWPTMQLGSVQQPAVGYTGPVVEILGQFDQANCNPIPCNGSAIAQNDPAFWPDSSNFTVNIRSGSGHDIDLDFGAAGTFEFLNELVQTLV